MAMTEPGMFLSHPGSEMLASYHCRLVWWFDGGEGVDG
jgi:hypothetical protein